MVGTNYFVSTENLSPKRSGILLFPNPPRFRQLIKAHNLRHPQSSGMVGEKTGKLGVVCVSIFPTCSIFLQWLVISPEI